MLERKTILKELDSISNQEKSLLGTDGYYYLGMFSEKLALALEELSKYDEQTARNILGSK